MKKPAKKKPAVHRSAKPKTEESSRWKDLKVAYDNAKIELDVTKEELRKTRDRSLMLDMSLQAAKRDRLPDFWEQIAHNPLANKAVMERAAASGCHPVQWLHAIIMAAYKNNALVNASTGTVVVKPPRPVIPPQQCEACDPFNGERCQGTAAYACMDGSRNVFCKTHALPMINAGWPMHSL